MLQKFLLKSWFYNAAEITWRKSQILVWGEVVFNSDICAEAPKPQIPRSQLLLTCEQCGTRLGAAEHPGEGACSRSPGKAFLVQYRKNCVPNKGGSDESMHGWYRDGNWTASRFCDPGRRHGGRSPQTLGVVSGLFVAGMIRKHITTIIRDLLRDVYMALLSVWVMYSAYLKL